MATYAECSVIAKIEILIGPSFLLNDLNVKQHILFFDGERGVEIREESLGPPAEDEIQVRTITSAISAGTERMAFEGRLPSTMLEDATLEAVGRASYPMPYGYACVGEVAHIGSSVPEAWMGERVFAFHPHADRFNIPVADAVRLSGDVHTDDAAFIPNVETSVSLLMDAKPVIGESICIYGCGVVGALCGKLLASYPLADLVGIDPDDSRRSHVESYCGIDTIEPLDAQQAFTGKSNANGSEAEGTDAVHGPDLILELSGNPDALNEAITLAGYGSRILVGSWYGTQSARLDLGTTFHRSHVRIRSSQVSTIDPGHRGRWTHQRRMNVVLGQLESLQPSQLVTSRRPFTEATEVYRELSDHPTRHMQILFTY